MRLRPFSILSLNRRFGYWSRRPLHEGRHEPGLQFAQGDIPCHGKDRIIRTIIFPAELLELVPRETGYGRNRSFHRMSVGGIEKKGLLERLIGKPPRRLVVQAD